MTDKVIRVNVTSSKSQKVTVSSSKVANEITASPDTSAYYSRLAKNWAVAEGLVENIDYSSKHYAQESKASADMAKTYENATQENYNMFMEASVNANSELQANREEALADIEESKAGAVDSLNSVKDENIASIEAKGDSLTSEITSLSKDYISQINTTGKSYDNLTHRNITNCITEIPQRIKLELNNGVLTLKAGSKVIVPNGFEADGVTPKFDYVTIENDVIKNLDAGTAVNVIEYNHIGNTLFVWGSSVCFSGTTQPTSQYFSWYDTTNNLMKNSDNSGTTTTPSSFPICITNSTRTSIDQVFNGFGYIGSTIWVDKGVKGLIPNGRNEDGTLNNIEFVTQKMLVYTFTDTLSDNAHLVIADYGSRVSWAASGIVWKYNNETNYITKEGVNRPDIVFVGNLIISNGVITNFQPKQPVRLVDWNDAKDYLKPERYDGQWTRKFMSLLVNGTASGGLNVSEGAYSASFDLSNYLPNDEHDYMVTVRIYSQNGTDTNAFSNFCVNGGYGSMSIGKVSGNSVYQDDTIIVPINSKRTLYIENAPSIGTSKGVAIQLENYRRVGKNK